MKKNSFLYQNATTPVISSLINAVKMNEWVKGYGTDEESARLIQLANEIRSKIEQESGYRIGKREFILLANYFPHREVINLHPVLSITKIEYWDSTTNAYVILSTALYRVTKMSDKMTCLLFEKNLPTIDSTREDAVKVTLIGGVEEPNDINSNAMAAIRGYVEAYFRDKLPQETQKAVEAIDRSIDNLKIWL
jgi:hypothetical protein